jgi:predicted outer membrane repeat protein
MNSRKLSTPILSLLLLCSLLLMPASAQAQSGIQASFSVNTHTMDPDASPGNGICADSAGRCSLIAAVQEANALAGADTITIPAGTYYLPGRLEPTETVTLTGAGMDNTIIHGRDAGTQPAFQIKANVTINSLEIQAFTQAVAIAPSQSNRTVTLSGVRVYNCGNYLAEVGSAVHNACSSCTLQISDSALSNNFSDVCGAVSNSGNLSIINSTIVGNSASTGYGGAVCSSGAGNSMLVSNSLIYSNSAPDGDNGNGGAFDIRSGTYGIENSEIFSNTAGNGGGAIAISFGTLTISLTKIYGNMANYGGGLALSADSATIDQCLIMDNEATGFGGGIYAWKSATISNSSIVYNTAGAKGGGVALRDQTLTIVNSTISGNSAGKDGGGLYTNNSSIARLANVTLADNTADSNQTDGVLAMGGGFYTDNSSRVQAKNSIVAKNHDLKAAPVEIVVSDCYGDFMSDGYNLIGNAGTFCDLSGDMSGMQYGTAGYTLDPQLGPLAAYTDLRNYYHPVLFGPVVDSGNPAGCRDYSNLLLTSDQLQESPRPYTGGSAVGYTPRCDLGAIESFRVRRDLFLPLLAK